MKRARARSPRRRLSSPSCGRARLRVPWPFDMSFTFASGRRSGGLAQPHSLARPLAGARVGARALPPHRQALLVAHAPVAPEIHEPLDVHGGLAPEIALDGELADAFPQPVHLGVGEVLDLR